MHQRCGWGGKLPRNRILAPSGRKGWNGCFSITDTNIVILVLAPNTSGASPGHKWRKLQNSAEACAAFLYSTHSVGAGTGNKMEPAPLVVGACSSQCRSLRHLWPNPAPAPGHLAWPSTAIWASGASMMFQERTAPSKWWAITCSRDSVTYSGDVGTTPSR